MHDTTSRPGLLMAASHQLLSSVHLDQGVTAHLAAAGHGPHADGAPGPGRWPAAAPSAQPQGTVSHAKLTWDITGTARSGW